MGALNDKKPGRPLDVLGITAAEERTYRALLTRGAASAEEIARALEVPLRTAQRLLDAIKAKGLTSHALERPRRYIPASPDVAIQSKALAATAKLPIRRPIT